MAVSRRQTGIVKHSLLIAGHSTSISLEEAFWSRLKRLATERGQAVAALVAEIDEKRDGANLSSAIRVYLLQAAERAIPGQYRPAADGSEGAPGGGMSKLG